MQEQLQITFKNLHAAPAVVRDISDRVEKLERIFPNIIGCRVAVEQAHHRQRKGRIYRVTINMRIPGHEIVVGHHGLLRPAHADIMQAVHDVFETLRRRLKDTARKMDGVVKHHETPFTGRIARISPDGEHGFIETPEGEIYFHRNALIGEAIEQCVIGDEVRLTYAADESLHGYQATSVRPLGRHHHEDTSGERP
ncbi:HPF/RaiA family ribosome-associated protein [Pseudokordiimonas caeni]|uniref:HPF/RaiA family ribosome-associated protein n=1 Tax=Pseudokordiimonas caeni TaxID=2997908 RepID=UPI002810D682|nr:HPF/RaiA family ribosome-associated protein [Pseudokordiimonas caeni]